MSFEKFLALLRELNARDVDYVLVGGVALNVHGIIRATEDIDLFVRPGDANVERLKDALRAVWRDSHIDEIQASDLAGRYPTIRYGPPDEDFVIDLLSRLGTEFDYDDLEVEIAELEGVAIRLATPLTLYKMKKGTVRLIDRADAAALKEKFKLGGDEDAG